MVVLELLRFSKPRWILLSHPGAQSKMSIRIEYLYCERASPPSHRATGFTCIFYFLCMFYAKFYAGFEGLSRRPFSSLQKLSCKITLCSFVGWNPRTIGWLGQFLWHLRLLICWSVSSKLSWHQSLKNLNKSLPLFSFSHIFFFLMFPSKDIWSDWFCCRHVFSVLLPPGWARQGYR